MLRRPRALRNEKTDRRFGGGAAPSASRQKREDRSTLRWWTTAGLWAIARHARTNQLGKLGRSALALAVCWAD
jgi:hypothetical protein